MRAQGGGSIVLVSSINAERGKFGQSNYAASKAGLNGFGKAAAREAGRFGIRVNLVAPGMTATPMLAALSEDDLRRALDETALGSLGRPEDVARAVLFLCSPMSGHITGQVLRVDGGQLMA
jgi:NAD(P)-dependent dehydrogenase (short-subunit alcohol dehydrogenase family)